MALYFATECLAFDPMGDALLGMDAGKDADASFRQLLRHHS